MLIFIFTLALFIYLITLSFASIEFYRIPVTLEIQIYLYNYTSLVSHKV